MIFCALTFIAGFIVGMVITSIVFFVMAHDAIGETEHLP